VSVRLPSGWRGTRLMLGIQYGFPALNELNACRAYVYILSYCTLRKPFYNYVIWGLVKYSRHWTFVLRAVRYPVFLYVPDNPGLYADTVHLSESFLWQYRRRGQWGARKTTVNILDQGRIQARLTDGVDRASTSPTPVFGANADERYICSRRGERAFKDASRQLTLTTARNVRYSFLSIQRKSLRLFKSKEVAK
jgi:hypothetical protein